jgi:hypothetical protein
MVFLAEETEATLEHGGSNGWRSRVFGVREPAWVLAVRRRQKLPTRWWTVVDFRPSFDIPSGGLLPKDTAQVRHCAYVRIEDQISVRFDFQGLPVWYARE